MCPFWEIFSFEWHMTANLHNNMFQENYINKTKKDVWIFFYWQAPLQVDLTPQIIQLTTPGHKNPAMEDAQLFVHKGVRLFISSLLFNIRPFSKNFLKIFTMDLCDRNYLQLRLFRRDYHLHQGYVRWKVNDEIGSQGGDYSDNRMWFRIEGQVDLWSTEFNFSPQSS